MKKHINGKVYDTASAKLIGSAKSGDYQEELYRKKTGEFFLYGERGQMPHTAEKGKTKRTNGSIWMPLTDDQARNWAKKHLSGEEYNSFLNLFSVAKTAVAKTKKYRTISIGLPAEVADALKKMAVNENRSVSSIVAELIMERQNQKS